MESKYIKLCTGTYMHAVIETSCRVSNVNGTNYTTRAVTQLLVSQVVVSNTSTEKSNPLSIPVQLVFVTEQVRRARGCFM